jgi:glycosyltransferase involved in cell wall biosynthesis
MSSIDLVSLVVVAYNEEAYLPDLLSDIQAQDFLHTKIELVFVDSNAGSNVAQRDLLESFTRSDHGFARVQVLDNPNTNLPAGCNVAIAAYTGDVFLLVDAHARIPADFVRRNVEVLEEGNMVCGGYRPVVLHQPGNWAATMLAAESSAFGASAAAYRRELPAQEVKSVFHAAYRREVIYAVGLYDERLQRTEDNDFNLRVREAGYKIICDPRIHSQQFLRANFAQLVSQKYKNGYWIGRTVYISRKAVSVTHLIPLVFVLALIGGLVLGLAGCVVYRALANWLWLPLLALAAVYLAAAVLASIAAIASSSAKNATMLVLPAVFATLHTAYGTGTIAGLAAGLRNNR